MLPIRFRLTIFHGLAILVVAALLVVLPAIWTVIQSMNLINDLVEARARETARLLAIGGGVDASTISDLTADEIYLVVRDGEGRIVQSAGIAPEELGELSESDANAAWRRALSNERLANSSKNWEIRVSAMPFTTPTGQTGVVEVWKSYGPAYQNLAPFGVVGVIIFPISLGLALLGSYLLARSALRPVSAITAAAREITDSDLSRRLPVKNKRDELGKLATTFNEMLDRLESAFGEREQALTEQRRFVADASHELRTPLTSILGYTRMLKQWGLADPATAKESLAAMEQQATRMAELAEALLRLARGDEGMPLVQEEHDLRPIAVEAVGAARVAAGGKVELSLEPGAEPILAMIDRTRVHQAVTILLDNAVKYTPQGGAVAVTVANDGDDALLSVTDTGVGIAPEHLPYVFDRFYRIDEARTTGGAGLGLAIAQQIADVHGGEIAVESTPGQGSTFTLRLPLTFPPS